MTLGGAVDAIASKCASGDAAACLIFAGVTRTADPEEADRLMRSTVRMAVTQCDVERRAEGCLVGGTLLVISGLKLEKKACLDEGVRLLERGCQLSSAKSCEVLAALDGTGKRTLAIEW
jgi:hypothetical protein